MKNHHKVIIIFFASFIVVISGYWLVTGAAVLQFPILKKPFLPAGTLISWVFLISFPLLFLVLSERTGQKSRGLKIFRAVVKFALGMGILWGFVAYFLSGNWNYVFTNEKKALIWIAYTGLIVVLPVLSFLIFTIVIAIQKLLRWLRK